MTDQPRLSDRLERSLSLSANRSEYTTEGAAIVLSNAIRGSISELQALEARVEEVEAENERLRTALEFGDHMAKAIDGWVAACAAGDPQFGFITSGTVSMVDEYRRLRALQSRQGATR